MKDKTGAEHGAARSTRQRVVSGEADLAVQAEHEIRCTRGATFLPYPAVLFQRTVVFLGGVTTDNKNVEAAKELSSPSSPGRTP